jgi:lipopolysaccharide transport system ATP-binding protein
MSNLAIQVKDLSKRYKIGTARRRNDTLRDEIAHKFTSVFRGNHRTSAENEIFWALRNISMEVQEGEVVGIIGRNGAGKSTLLKVLSHITYPTEGRAEIFGRVGSLLDVGTGFHPELTGRENIYLSGAVLGMKKSEINNRFDEIVAFSEIGKFLDTPVKHYSSGMYVRLAFAVAAHLEPEILIVDEVLAVGDASFQKKCLGRMEDVAKKGRTVIFVSHNLSAVRALCSRCIWLNGGVIQREGDTGTVIDLYVAATIGNNQNNLPITQRKREGGYGQKARIIDLQLESHSGKNPDTLDSTKPLRVRIAVECYCERVRICPEITICDSEKNLILMHSGAMQGVVYDLARGKHIFECQIERLNLYAGEYAMNLGLSLPGQETVDYVPSAYIFNISDFDPRGSGFNLTRQSGFGIFYVNHNWSKLA